MLKKIPMDVVSATYLAEHVATTMGLDVKPQQGKASILAAMATAGFPTDFIEIEMEGEPEPVIERREPPRERHTKHRRMVQVLIPMEEKAGGSEPVWTNVNGISIFVPRGSPHWIDYKYYESILHAEARLPITDEDTKIIDWRIVPQYPISALYIEPELTEAEIRAMPEAIRRVFLNEPKDGPKKVAA